MYGETNKYELGIVDTRNIITSIKDKYNYDFKDFALTSFKRRLERIMTIYGLKDAEALIKKIKEDKDFFEIFLSEIPVETTEMFRDPRMWRELIDVIITKGIRPSGNFKIWVGGNESGEDLFSLMILLHESNLENSVKVYNSALSERNIDRIKSGYFNLKKLEVNEANYIKLNGKKELKDYFSIENNNSYWNKDLIKNVIFTKTDLNFKDCPKSVNLVIFRNQMIYYNQPYQDKVLKVIHENLVPSGHLIIGAKETLEHCILGKKFKLIDPKEKILKKSLS